MRVAYRVLAYLVAIEVAVQAAVMVWAIAGLGIWVDDGGVVDKTIMESSDEPFPEVAGFGIHWFNGMMIVPAIALLLLIASFFAKIPRGIVFALVILALVVLQVFLGLFGHEASFWGILHGINALALFSTAVRAGMRTQGPAVAPSMTDHAAA